MGNTVVVKPAPQDPLAVIRVCELVRRGGLPAGRRQRRHRHRAPTSARRSVASKHVDMVSFTGSTAVGQRIGEVAGRDMKRLLLELGGKGAAVVFDDADLRTAIVDDRQRVGVPLGPDLHRADPGARAARRLRPARRRARRPRPAR